MIVVAGHLTVAAGGRDAYVAGCRPVVELARRTPGCVAFWIAADPFEADRVVVLEQWESRAALEAFRGSGPPDDQQAAIVAAEVWEHEVAASTRIA